MKSNYQNPTMEIVMFADVITTSEVASGPTLPGNNGSSPFDPLT